MTAYTKRTHAHTYTGSPSTHIAKNRAYGHEKLNSNGSETECLSQFCEFFRICDGTPIAILYMLLSADTQFEACSSLSAAIRNDAFISGYQLYYRSSCAITSSG